MPAHHQPKTSKTERAALPQISPTRPRTPEEKRERPTAPSQDVQHAAAAIGWGNAEPPLLANGAIRPSAYRAVLHCFFEQDDPERAG